MTGAARPHAEATRVTELTREQCLDHLQYRAFVGRIGIIVDGRPLIFPVNYLADADSIVFCTAPGTKLDALAKGAQVAFEVDESHPLDHAGWSVLVQGNASALTDPEQLERLRRGPLKSWATSPSQHWVRISIEQISGRRISG